MKTSSDVVNADREFIQPQEWSGAMNGTAGKLELAGCIALLLAVYALFLASVTEPYRPDIAAWIDGGKTPTAARPDQMRLAIRN